ncbi:hypothetical protein HCN44_009852 [Aphidius gifuensis]|uniref:Uncharacterized protein n=1 Tax=Aphidius gifuensis TaxID=684658 RepID=A0A834Y3H2_APHGI|nr:hypothetical protein HCN44_009852 [Aphidius gifuensis]
MAINAVLEQNRIIKRLDSIDTTMGKINKTVSAIRNEVLEHRRAIEDSRADVTRIDGSLQTIQGVVDAGIGGVLDNDGIIRNFITRQYELLKNWIIEALNIWSQDDNKPCQSVGVFTLKLIGILSKNENYFDDIINNNIFDKIFKIFNLRNDDLSVSMKMAYTSLLVDVIDHKIGRIWIDMVKYAQLNPQMYVTRETQRFIYTMLAKGSQDKVFCKKYNNCNKSNKLALIYMKKLQTLRPFEMPHGHKFNHQNIALMITPMGSLMKRELMQNDCAKIFIDKLFDVTCQPVQRVC